MHRLCRNRGRRIRPSDKDLVFRTVFFLLFAVFAVTFVLLNIHTDWRSPSVAYLLFSATVGVKVCTVTAWLLYRRFPDKLNEMRHRQKLARMVLENQWYEQSDTKQSEGFFKDLPASSKPKIAHFPRMYYRMENGLLHITAEITLGKFQEPLLHLENKLESGLYCELVSRELLDGFVEYTLLYDMISNRIPISEVRVEHGKMRLMQNTYWEFDSLPHMLIAGGTGGGKTYFILTLIRALLENNAVLHILDPKNADLADLSSVLPNVYSRREETVSRISSHRTSGMWRWAAGISVTVRWARPALFQLESRKSATVSSTIRSALSGDTRMSPTFSRTMPMPMRLPRKSRWLRRSSARKDARKHRRGLSAISGSIQSGRNSRMFRSAPS